MVRIKPFAAVRPPKHYAEEVAARPYDVLNSVEAKAEAAAESLGTYLAGDRTKLIEMADIALASVQY